MSDDVPLGDDPGVFLARLREYEWWLFRGIVFSRVAIVVGLGLILPDERSVHGQGLFRVIVAAWVLALVWVVLPAVRPRRVFGHVAARRTLVWLDVAVLVVLLVVGGGWRNPFYLYAWSPIGLASAADAAGDRDRLPVAACELWGLARRRLGPRGASRRRRGLGVASARILRRGGRAFWYVRRRFDDLAVTAAAYHDQASAAITVTQAAAAAAEREEIAFGLHRRLRQVFPALSLRLAALQEEQPSDELLQTELEQIADIAARADAALDRMMASLRCGEGTDQTSTFGTGRDIPGFVGSTDG